MQLAAGLRAARRWPPATSPTQPQRTPPVDGYDPPVSDVRYALSRGGSVAYEVREGGPVDLLYLSDWVVPIDAMRERHLGRFLDGLNRFARVVVFDRRGVGQSDPLSANDPPTLEQWVEDAVAVLNDAGMRSAAVVGGDVGGQVAMLLAAAHPDRVNALVLANTCARFRWADDHPCGAVEDEVQFMLDLVEQMWGRGYPPLEMLAPSMAHDEDFGSYVNRVQRRGASPAVARAVLQLSADADLRPALPSIQCHTLVLHSRGDQIIPATQGRILASRIAGSAYVELPGADHPLPIADGSRIVHEVEAFLTGHRGSTHTDRAFAAVLFTDLVGSTETLAQLGDRRWRDLLDQHDGAVAAEVVRHGGRYSSSTGDGVVAIFDGVVRAARCAMDIATDLRRLGLRMRAGVHVGEVELRDTGVAGLAVHIAARITALAGPDELLLSAAAVDLASGSGFTFKPRGEHQLKGVPGTWSLSALRLPDPG